jgi:hypothetical protein
VNHLEFSRDGRLLLATSQDRTVSLYDMATKSRLGDPIPRGTGGGAGSLRADGMAMAVGDGSGVAIWDLDPTHLAGLACELAGRNLTQDEWASYLGHVGDFRPTCPVPN